MTTTRERPRSSRIRAWRTRGMVGVAALALAAPAAIVTATTQASAQDAEPQPAAQDGAGPVVPADAQNWADQAEMTWDDYVPVRPQEWNSAENSQGSQNQYRTAVILLDFEDQPFLITQEAGSHPFENPQDDWEPVAPEKVNEWYYDYYAVPNGFNNGQTLHGYWMETSHGRIGVDVEVFGPYTMPGKLHEYGLPGFGLPVGDEADSTCPAEDRCVGIVDPDREDFNDRNIRHVANELWRNDIGCPPTDAQGQVSLCGFDNGFYVTAGHDETSTWQEFGEMMFRTAEDVPASFGPPSTEAGPVLNSAGNPIPNAVGTRYVPWTSWQSAANHWPNAGGGTSTQAENSGLAVFAHEFSHLRGLPDNYNNPFATSPVRNYTGYWEMMSRGSFNGPGGTHNRWQVPNAGGSALGPHHTLHFKTIGSRRLGVLTADETVELDRAGLAQQGIALVPLKARSSIPNGDDVGLTVNLGESGFVRGTCESRVDDPFWCTPVVVDPEDPEEDPPNWQKFTMEVVDRVGNDSFTAGHGVLLAQARTAGSPQVWLVDANPEDIDRIDFYRPGNDEEPGGEPVPVTKADPRQLDDATFHAGAGSGSEFEYIDTPNNLHFYVLDTYRDEDGALFYDVAVRNLTGAGTAARDVALGEVAPHPVGDSTALLTVPLTNTGAAGEGLFGSDVYRISSSVQGAGWEVQLPYEVRAAEAGATVTVPVYATAGDGAAETATMIVTATSEADPTATMTIELDLDRADLDVTFDSTAALLDAYHDSGVLSRSEFQRLDAQLNIAEGNRGRSAERALDRFAGLAGGIADAGMRNLASAALLTVADELRDDI